MSINASDLYDLPRRPEASRPAIEAPRKAEPQAQTPRESYDQMVSRLIQEAKDTWKNDQAIAGIPAPDRGTLEVNAYQVGNELCTRAIKASAIDPRRTTADGKAEGKRDRAKARAEVIALYDGPSRQIVVETVQEYLAGKLAEARASLPAEDDGRGSFPDEEEAGARG